MAGKVDLGKLQQVRMVRSDLVPAVAVVAALAAIMHKYTENRWMQDMIRELLK